jgi:hypothetical protein
MADTLPPEIADLTPKLQRAFTLSWDMVLGIVSEAFATGRMLGKAEASVEFKTKLTAMLDLRDIGPSHPAPPLPAAPRATAAVPPPLPPMPKAPKRAQRGSIKPTVIGILKDYGPPGLKPNEVAIRAALNENSVRGALNQLAHAGVTRKEGDLWVLVDQNEKPGPRMAPA